ncbi:MAG: hypothetical protein VX278_05430 [Myxococcota bacterium]|nr:hypothetical protein [Myxococcota bacterium]
MRSLFLIGLPILACSDGIIKPQSPEALPSQSDGVCDISIKNTSPYPQDTTMYYRDAIEVEFSKRDASASISLTDADGVDIAGEQVLSESTLRFIPSTPLRFKESYTAYIQYCGSEEPVALPFETSALGEPLIEGNHALVGSTYAVNLASGRILEPVGVGEVLRGILQNTFLVQIQDVVNDQLYVRSALSVADSIEQNYCVSTIEDFPAADFSEAPYFSLAAQDIDIEIGGYQSTIYNLSLSGVFASDASFFTEIAGAGDFDGRELYPIMGDFGFDVNSGSEFCTLLETFNVSCTPCPTDGESYCLHLVLDQLEANIEALDIDPVCEGNCHEQCVENTPTCTVPQEQYATCE